MNIIVWSNELGKLSETSENDFRIVEVIESDEQDVNNIVSRSIRKGFKLTKVHVLDDGEYFTLKHKAKSFDILKENIDKEVLCRMKLENGSKEINI